MTSILDAELTQDAFLGGQVMAWQPRTGYRAGVDAVLLAAACPAQKGEAVLELGCGVGVAALCVAARTGAVVTGVELQARYAALARRNKIDVVEADIASLPTDLRQRQVQHVIFNPPYFEPQRGATAPDAGRAAARAESAPLSLWFDVAEKRLRAKGTVTVINRAERLPDMLRAIGPTLGSIEVLPLQPRSRRDARLVLLRAKKDGRAAFRLHAPVIMHSAAQHTGDHPDYTVQIQGILQDAAPLSFGA